MCWSIQFHIVKKKITKILKRHFLKIALFEIPFLKSQISLSFWAGELRDISFDPKFLTDYYTDRNSISATRYHFLEKYT